MGADRHGCSARAPQCWQLLEQGPAQPPAQHGQWCTVLWSRRSVGTGLAELTGGRGTGPGLAAGVMAACDQDPHAFPWTSQWHLGWGHSTETRGQAGVSLPAMYQHQLEEEEDGHSLSRG